MRDSASWLSLPRGEFTQPMAHLFVHPCIIFFLIMTLTYKLLGNPEKPQPFPNVFRVEIDNKTEVPTNRLTEEAIQFCKSVGSKAETVDDIAGADPTDSIIQDEIKKALQRANEVGYV